MCRYSPGSLMLTGGRGLVSGAGVWGGWALNPRLHCLLTPLCPCPSLWGPRVSFTLTGHLP